MNAKRLLASEPALAAGTGQVVIALIVGLGFSLTPGQAGAVEAATAALGALLVAVSVRPVPPAAFTGALSAAGTLLAAFGLPHASAGSVSTVSAVLAALLATALRGHVSPKQAVVAPHP